MTNIIINSPHQDFEKIKLVDKHEIEYWEARELMELLEYTQWRNFELVIEKAKIACRKSGQDTTGHFADISKKVDLGMGRTRSVPDYKLSRYACYLIAQNGDPSKQPIANAQTYFAIQSRRQELSQTLQEDQKRINYRNEIREQNRQLFSTAKQAGVTEFGKFNDSGYMGLYGMHIPSIKEKKGIGSESILGRAGP